jgi:hypothetical protein
MAKLSAKRHQIHIEPKLRLTAHEATGLASVFAWVFARLRALSSFLPSSQATSDPESMNRRTPASIIAASGTFTSGV